MPSGPHTHNLKPLLLIPIAVLLVLHPLLLHGPSCGQDLAFHIQSWLDAAHQLRHGALYPHWDLTAAWNAGEPRFLFYPPLSWLLGAILTLIFPINLCPTIFIAIALLAAGLTFHKLASEFASPNAALIASTFYLANPYMLFTAFERSALAELLAAAWIPLLLLALLHPIPSSRPAAQATIRGIATPLALLWLTNAPAAVIGSYTLALLAAFRVLHFLMHPSSRPERSGVERPLYSAPPATSPQTSATTGYPEASASGLIPPQKIKGFSPAGMPFRLALTYLAAALLGLTLPAIYLLPAACERKYIQTAMAILPNMRYQDNFLFTPTPDAPHNAVNHTISLLALTLLLITALSLIAVFGTIRNSAVLSEAAEPALPKNSAHTVGPFPPNNRVPQVSTLRPGLFEPLTLTYTLALLTLLIAFLLTPLSAPIWQHLPNLAYLQFPWRLLILLTPILALSIALLIDTLPRTLKPSPSAQDLASETWVGTMPRLTTALTLLLPLALAVPAYRLYHQPCDPTDDPTHLAQLFTTHHGFPPTDEYTPTPADNDPLRSNNPAYWLAASPNDPAPNTQPTPAELNPNLDTDDTPIPDTQTLSTPAPRHLTLNLTQPANLVLNLRDYPNWQIAITPKPSPSPRNPAENSRRPRRTDGLIALQLPAGRQTLNITWRRTLDQTFGLILTALSLIALAFTYRRRKASAQKASAQKASA